MVDLDEPVEEGLLHDEVEIEDLEYDPETDTFTYPCPCGDEFSITRVSSVRLGSSFSNPRQLRGLTLPTPFVNIG